MDYRDRKFVKDHAFETLRFYLPVFLDRDFGGYHCTFLDDGRVYDREQKDFIGTSRFMLNLSFAIFLGGPEAYRDSIRQGLEFAEIVFRDDVYGGYHQTARGDQAVAGNKITYGHAFYLCAVSNAARAGVREAYALIPRVFHVLEEKLFDAAHGLYVDECTTDFTQIIPYRGQNCNMHMTEACLAAFEATGEAKYLEKARQLAHTVTVELAAQTDDLVCEHYDTNWRADLDYNKDADKYDLGNLLRPCGFLPGHFAEWSKLLVILERYRPEPWQLPTAERLLQKAFELGWDEKRSGLNYAISIDGHIIDSDRHFWAHAEMFAAAAALAMRTGNEAYWNIYDRVWDYSFKHFVDHERGGWYRLLSADTLNSMDDRKSPPPKTDYHVIGACYEVLRSMEYHNHGGKIPSTKES
jgi:mannose/cellobiose epimerase-like protein (N-acyl-D-glucosamine 2-epimerase family)